MQLRRQRALLVARTGAFAALLAAGAWISVPFLPVPITLQTLFVFLAGGVMGWRAIYPSLLYLVMGVMNLPVFHNGTAGVGVLMGPTGGYLVGFVFAAFLIGIAFERDSIYCHAGGLTAGTCAIYLFGAGWLHLSSGISIPLALLMGVVPFIPGDVMKAAAALVISRRIRKLRHGNDAPPPGNNPGSTP
ncbi:MAG: biotin transporter BioY [Methanolinea sp.]|nr:biotin transporter BioY [Methanolinea sp.]